MVIRSDHRTEHHHACLLFYIPFHRKDRKRFRSFFFAEMLYENGRNGPVALKATFE